MNRKMLAGVLGLALPLTSVAAEDTKVPAGTKEVVIKVTPAQADAPTVSFALKGRHAHVTPSRRGFTHTAGGNIDVQQPSPDTIVILMTGVAVAGGHPTSDSCASMHFEIDQCLDIEYDEAKVKRAEVTMEGRVVGLLRSQGKGKKCSGGGAEQGAATATLAGPTALSLTVQPHSVGCGDNLSINCNEGPCAGPAVKGQYHLKGCWSISASHPRSVLPSKAASAEFAGDGALDPLWISYWEPFRGATKKDFGFQLTIKVADKTEPEPAANGNGAAAPAPAAPAPAAEPKK